MNEASREPTELGEILLKRLDELSMSQAELARRTRLAKNTIKNSIYGHHEPHRKTVEILAEALEFPVEVLSRAGKAAGAASESFWNWLARLDNPALWISGAGAALIGALLYLDGPVPSPSPRVQWVQFGVILLLLVLLLAKRHRTDPDVYQKASQSLKAAVVSARDFRRYWAWVWTSWLALYFILAFASRLALVPGCDPVVGKTRWTLFILNTVQNGGTAFFFLCYQVLARRTVEDDLSRRTLPVARIGLALSLLALGELSAIFFDSGFQQWFGWLSGFGQGTALALLVGRLDSRYVEAPSAVIALLYFYAAIQGAWPVLSCEYGWMLVFFALVLKCFFFLLVSWLFESDVILFYLTRMRKLDQDVRHDRSYFLQLYRQGAVEKL